MKTVGVTAVETNDLRKAAEMAIETLLDPKSRADQVADAVQALRQALDDKPAVKSYAGGKPNYCTPEETRDSSSWVDCTDEQLMEEVRRRGFVIRDAQIGREWVGLTDEDLSVCDEDGVLLAKYWEAKLKEKNSVSRD